MRRVLVAAAAMTIPVSLVTVAFTSPALAKTKPEHSITCKTISGSLSTGINLSGCNGNTGGGASNLSTTALANGGTVQWTNGTTTTFAAPTLGSAKNSKCKATGDSVVTFTGAVTADTSGLTNLGTYFGEVCVVGGSTITGLKPFKIT